MLRVKFHPDSDEEKLLEEATNSYRNIWKSAGKRIIEKIEDISGLKFKGSFINAVIFIAKFPSQSYPLCLKAYESDEAKLATLIHELCHRVIAGNRIDSSKSELKIIKDIPLRVHMFLDLILYDIWSELYGEEFARRCVKLESKIDRTDIYKKAWKWALRFNRQERLKLFSECVENSKST